MTLNNVMTNLLNKYKKITNIYMNIYMPPPQNMNTLLRGFETYSTVLLHAGGSLIVMNTQLDMIVNMMNMLNNVPILRK